MLRLAARATAAVVALAAALSTLSLALCACGRRVQEHLGPGVESLPPALRERARGLTHSVPFRLGIADLAKGDEIHIGGILGDRPRLAAGGTYCVWGRYKLASVESALLSLLISDKGGFQADERGPVSERFDRGEGDFALFLHIEKRDWLLLMFMRAPPGRGQTPIGGIHFAAVDETEPE